MSGRRVLLVGINFHPEPTGIAPYTTQAAEWLASVGDDVQAVVGVPHYPEWVISDQYRRKLRTDEQHGFVAVRRLRHVVPSRQSALTRSLYEATFGAHVFVQRLPWRPDVVVAIVPSLLGAAAAAAIAFRTRAPLVLWMQDLMGPAAAQSGIAGGGRIARLTMGLERWVLRRAAGVVIVSEAFHGYVRSSGVLEGAIHVVPNWTHIEAPQRDRAAVRRQLGWRDDEIVVLHTGNMGLKQGLDNVVAAAKLAPNDAPLRFVLMGDGNQRVRLERAARGVEAMQLLDPVPSADYADALAAADILLVNERASATDMSLPGKLTSYFSVGLPVVAAVPSSGGTAVEVERSRGGVLVPPEEPAALLAAVRLLGADPAERARLGRAGAEHARAHLGRAASLKQLHQVLDIVGSHVGGRRPETTRSKSDSRDDVASS